MNKKSDGFTLIELLVVIAIIAVIVAFAVANFVGARARAKDLKRKAELTQLKSALRLYYNDFNTYPLPASSVDNDLEGCGNGTPPVASCAVTCNGQFAAGATQCDNVYMKLLPEATDYIWSYQQMASGENFCLSATLDNASDAEVAKSQARCSSVCGAAVPSTDYVLCAD